MEGSIVKSNDLYGAEALPEYFPNIIHLTVFSYVDGRPVFCVARKHSSSSKGYAPYKSYIKKYRYKSAPNKKSIVVGSLKCGSASMILVNA